MPARRPPVRVAYERGMRPDDVVVTAPAFDNDLGFPQRVEDFTVEQFVTQACVKTFDKAVLSRAAWRDVGGIGPGGRNPILHGLSYELRAVVGTDVAWHATQDEEVGESIDDVDGLELAIDADRQALMGELVDDVEHAVPPAIMGAVLDEVVRPDVIGMRRLQPDARSIGKPQPPAFRLLPRDLQPLTSPDPLDPRVADQPAGIAQQRSDLAVA